MMKSLSLIIGFLSYTAILLTGSDCNKEDASVESVSGLYIFIHAKPKCETVFIGTVKAGMTWKGIAEEKFNALVKKTKKDYPEAEAILISDDLEKCDAVKFK